MWLWEETSISFIYSTILTWSPVWVFFIFLWKRNHTVCFYSITCALRWQLSRGTNCRCKSMKATVLLMKPQPQLPQKNTQFPGQGRSHLHIILHWWESWEQIWGPQRNLQHRYEGNGPLSTIIFPFFKKIFFIFTKKERERSINQLPCAPKWGSNPQPRHVPWSGIKPFTLQNDAQPTKLHQSGHYSFLTLMFLSGVRFELFREIGSYGDHLCLFSSFNHHLRICLLIFREKETLMWERNIDRLPPTHALTGHQTRSPRLCSDRESTPRCYLRCARQCRKQPSPWPGPVWRFKTDNSGNFWRGRRTKWHRDCFSLVLCHTVSLFFTMLYLTKPPKLKTVHFREIILNRNKK